MSITFACGGCGATATTLVPEIGNKHDRYAIAVYAGKYQLGYIPYEHSRDIARWIKEGSSVTAALYKVIGGTRDKPTLGVLMDILVTH